MHLAHGVILMTMLLHALFIQALRCSAYLMLMKGNMMRMMLMKGFDGAGLCIDE
jgi:hypothetical protein